MSDTVSSSDQFKIGVTVDADTAQFESKIAAVENRTRQTAERLQTTMNAMGRTVSFGGIINQAQFTSYQSGNGGTGSGFGFGGTSRNQFSGGSLNISQSGGNSLAALRQLLMTGGNAGTQNGAFGGNFGNVPANLITGGALNFNQAGGSGAVGGFNTPRYGVGGLGTQAGGSPFQGNFGTTPIRMVTNGPININQAGGTSGAAVTNTNSAFSPQIMNDLVLGLGKLGKGILSAAGAIGVFSLVAGSLGHVGNAAFAGSRGNSSSMIDRAEQAAIAENGIWGSIKKGYRDFARGDAIEANRRGNPMSFDYGKSDDEIRLKYADPEVSANLVKTVAMQGREGLTTRRPGANKTAAELKNFAESQNDRREQFRSQGAPDAQISALELSDRMIYNRKAKLAEEDYNFDLKRIDSQNRQIRLKTIGLSLQSQIEGINNKFNEAIGKTEDDPTRERLEKLRKAELMAAQMGGMTGGSSFSLSSMAIGPDMAVAGRANPNSARDAAVVHDLLRDIASSNKQVPLPVLPHH